MIVFSILHGSIFENTTIAIEKLDFTFPSRVGREKSDLLSLGGFARLFHRRSQAFL
jgi:hypothetical protein